MTWSPSSIFRGRTNRPGGKRTETGRGGELCHFFIHEDPALSGGARYSLVVQYWFFYPFNDSGNNHEGDWEHLSVVLTTEERAGADGPERGLLRGSDITRSWMGAAARPIPW